MAQELGSLEGAMAGPPVKEGVETAVAVANGAMVAVGQAVVEQATVAAGARARAMVEEETDLVAEEMASAARVVTAPVGPAAAEALDSPEEHAARVEVKRVVAEAAMEAASLVGVKAAANAVMEAVVMAVVGVVGAVGDKAMAPAVRAAVAMVVVRVEGVVMVVESQAGAEVA